MSCYHPFKLFDIGERTDKGKIKYKMLPYYFDEVRKNNGTFTREFKVARCGKCIGCRLDNAREWAVRCALESRYHEYNYFITLTYEDNSNGSLDKADLQKFIKRIRKFISCRYFACGEYGEKSLRKHFHIILFSDNELPELKKVNTRRCVPVYSSSWLESRWPYGLVDITTFSYSTAGYVARYCLKKANQQDRNYNVSDTKLFDDLGYEQPFITMSRNPGLGYQFFKDNPDIYKYDEIYISNNNKSIKTKPPHYFDYLLDKVDSEKLKDIKDARELIAFIDNSNLGVFDFESYLNAQEQSKLKSIKKLVKGEI